MDFFAWLAEWVDYFGLIFLVVILVPNIVYAVKADGGEPAFRNRAVEATEQVGRYGCMAFMIFRVPYVRFGFWFGHAFTVYLAVNAALCFAYCVFWIVCWKRDDRLRALSLSILPSAVFLFSGVVAANLPLIAFALLFAPSHIYISLKNADAAGAV